MREQGAPAHRWTSVAVLGDSYIAGLGVHGRSFARIAAAELGISDLQVLARSAHAIDQTLARLPRLTASPPSLVIVAVGGADAMVHASGTMQKLLDRFAPKSWRGVYGLEPRVVEKGENRLQKIRERFTREVKLALKHLSLPLTGGYQRVPLAEFAPQFEQLLDGLEALGCDVVVIGIPAVDPRLFPRSNEQFDGYNAAMERSVAFHPRVVWVPAPAVDRWGDYCVDHAHLNDEGHRKTAEVLLDVLRSSPALLTP